jgi:hypothetical protein
MPTMLATYLPRSRSAKRQSFREGEPWTCYAVFWVA